MNILVIRMRQMGDAILATAMLNTLRASFPDARIDFVLNSRLAALFEGHPSIDSVIGFTDDERRSTVKYVRRVWHTVHHTHYDVIIDMRSTVNTMLFALLSPSTRHRIGLRKAYTRLAFNHLVPACRGDESMVDHNLRMLRPLETLGALRYDRRFTLAVTAAEVEAFRSEMHGHGIDPARPVMLVGATTRVPSKTWDMAGMAWVMERFIDRYPDVQVVFNYAPGREEADARSLYERLGRPPRVFIDVQARSQRQLMAMACCVDGYFGNEGGARHIMQAMGVPSLVVCAPTSSRATWIPQNDVPAWAIDVRDVATAQTLEHMTYQEQFALIDREHVWERLQLFMKQCINLNDTETRQ